MKGKRRIQATPQVTLDSTYVVSWLRGHLSPIYSTVGPWVTSEIRSHGAM